MQLKHILQISTFIYNDLLYGKMSKHLSCVHIWGGAGQSQLLKIKLNSSYWTYLLKIVDNYITAYITLY